MRLTSLTATTFAYYQSRAALRALYRTVSWRKKASVDILKVMVFKGESRSRKREEQRKGCALPVTFGQGLKETKLIMPDEREHDSLSSVKRVSQLTEKRYFR